MTSPFAYAGLTDDRRDLGLMAGDYLAENALDDHAGAQLDWFGIGIPESFGGSGGDFADLAVVIEAAGATCAATSVPWTTGVVAQLLLRAGGHDELLAEIASGAAQVALPVGDATVRPGSTLVHGARTPTAALLPLADGVAWIPADQLKLDPRLSLDSSRFLHEVVCPESRSAIVLATAGELRHAVAQVAVLDAVGAARVALERTVRYAGERQQFGRPIGSFQAYKHRCVDAFAALKVAQASAFRAAKDGDAFLSLAAARAGIADCTRICGEAIQLHGGIGYSWESGLHALLKRSRSAEIIAGQSDELASDLLALAVP